jgi:hypothetical protein
MVIIKGVRNQDKVQENKHNYKKFNNGSPIISGLLFETSIGNDLKRSV